MKYFIAILTVTLLTTHARAGADAGGGGSICANPTVNNDQPILLDLADSNLNDPPNTGTRLQSTKVADTIGFDSFDLNSNAAAKIAIAKIEEWKSSPGSERSMALVEQGLTHMNFYITPLEIHRLSRVALAPNSACKLSDLHTTILYRDGAANISIPVWNQIGLQSQAGMFIHEGLRNVQILQQLDGTDLDLERLTLTILTSSPNEATKLDQDPFFQKFVVKTPQFKLDVACNKVTAFIDKHAELQTSTLKADAIKLCLMDFSSNGSENNLTEFIYRGVETDLLNIDAQTGDTNIMIEIVYVYNAFDDLMTSVVHQLISRDDYLFRDFTTAISGITEGLNLNLIRGFVNGKIKSSWWSPSRKQKIKNIRATLARIQTQYQSDLDQE